MVIIFLPENALPLAVISGGAVLQSGSIGCRPGKSDRTAIQSGNRIKSTFRTNRTAGKNRKGIKNLPRQTQKGVSGKVKRHHQIITKKAARFLLPPQKEKRLTETRLELDEQEQRAINERLAYIADHINAPPKSASNILCRMNAKAEVRLLRFLEKLIEYPTQMQLSL